MNANNFSQEGKRMFQAEPALVYDSVQVFAHGLAALDRSHDLRPANLSCEKEEPWDDGLSLYNYINAVRTFYNFSLSSQLAYQRDRIAQHEQFEKEIPVIIKHKKCEWKKYSRVKNNTTLWSRFMTMSPEEILKEPLKITRYKFLLRT